MLEPPPLRLSERALKLSMYIRVSLMLLGINALLRLLSFSIWAMVTDLFVCAYGFLAMRPLKEREAAVSFESYACMAFLTGFNALTSVFSLVNIITGKQEFYENLQPWQLIVGYCTNSMAIAIYILITALVYVLTKELQSLRAQMDEENAPLLRPSSSSSARRIAGLPSARAYVSSTQTIFATGSYSSREQPEKPDKERFPGKGYSLK